MKCIKCGQELKGNKKFCGNCGQKVHIDNTELLDKNLSAKKCIHCGTESHRETKCCSECGAVFDMPRSLTEKVAYGGLFLFILLTLVVFTIPKTNKTSSPLTNYDDANINTGTANSKSTIIKPNHSKTAMANEGLGLTYDEIVKGFEELMIESNIDGIQTYHSKENPMFELMIMGDKNNISSTFMSVKMEYSNADKSLNGLLGYISRTIPEITKPKDWLEKILSDKSSFFEGMLLKKINIGSKLVVVGVISGNSSPVISVVVLKNFKDPIMKQFELTTIRLMTSTADKEAEKKNSTIDVNSSGNASNNSIVEYIKTGNVDEVKKMLSGKNNDINREMEYGETFLMVACQNGNAEMVRLLIENGADVKAELKGIKAGNAIGFAAATGNIEIIKLLLSNGANVNDSFSPGKGGIITPLVTATAKNDIKMVLFLLENGANVNGCMNPENETPLMLAVKNKNVDLVKLFLSKGASKNDKNENNKTALDIAREYGYNDIIKFLDDENNRNMPNHSSAGKIQYFKVVNVKSNDSLNIRREANPKSAKISEIPFNATNVEYYGETQKVNNVLWVKIKYSNIAGWVNANFLEKIN